MTTANALNDDDKRAVRLEFHTAEKSVRVTFTNGSIVDYSQAAYYDHVYNGMIVPDNAEIVIDGKIQDDNFPELHVSEENPESNDSGTYVHIDPVMISSIIRSSVLSEFVDSLPWLLIIIGWIVLIALGH